MKNYNLNTERINPEELMDLVSPKDEVIGKALRKDVYSSGVNNYRVINVFVFDKDEKIWLPTRSKNKSIFPNCYDFSCGEHVNSGESYESAALRGIEEELNIKANSDDLKELAYLKPTQVSSFMKIFSLVVDDAPEYNKKDFTEADFYSVEELNEMIEKNIHKFKSDIPKVLKVLFD